MEMIGHALMLGVSFGAIMAAFASLIGIAVWLVRWAWRFALAFAQGALSSSRRNNAPVAFLRAH